MIRFEFRVYAGCKKYGGRHEMSARYAKNFPLILKAEMHAVIYQMLNLMWEDGWFDDADGDDVARLEEVTKFEGRVTSE